MGKLALGASVAWVSMLSAACGQSDDRPVNQHFVSGGGSGGVGAGGGGGGSGGAKCTPDVTKGGKVEGNLITRDVLVSDIQPFGGQAEVKAIGANCPSVSTTWDALGAPSEDGGPPLFLLESVKVDSPSFLHIYPTSNDPVYPTLIAADPTYVGVVLDAFGMFRVDSVDEVYTSTGTARDPEKGTIIVQVVNGAITNPMSGVSVNMGTNASPAYPGLSGWQLGGETDVSGVAVLLNATAQPYPGQSWSVSISMGSSKELFKCPAEKGAVTLCWISPTSGF